MSPQQTSSKKVRIGVLLALGECEGNKFELVDERKRVPPRPWVKGADSDFFIDRPEIKHKGQIIPGVIGIPGDVSVAEYIKFKHGDKVEIDYINPKDITTERLKSNDINLLLIYDLLEAFHTDKSGTVFSKFREALHKAGNIYPSLEYQEFINSKLLYYNHFKAKNLPIAPTITISKEEWNARVTQLAARGGPAAVADEVIEEIQRQGFKKFIAKPVYGQEAIGCGIFTMDDLKKVEFKRFLVKSFKKYPGLIIQDFIHDFGDTKASPELRMYFVGREYQFTAMATKKKTYTLAEDGVGGTYSLPPHIDLRALKELAYRAMDNMPPVTLKRANGQGVNLPRLLTRVDMGCIRNGVFDPWINEVEFVPSMYIEDHRCPLDALLGEQMVKITKQYLNAQARRPLPSPSRSSPRADALCTPPRRRMGATVSPRSALKRSFGSPNKTQRKSKLQALAKPLSVQWGPLRRKASGDSPKKRVLKIAMKTKRSIATKSKRSIATKIRRSTRA